jgi:hypothetical protein
MTLDKAEKGHLGLKQRLLEACLSPSSSFEHAALIIYVTFVTLKAADSCIAGKWEVAGEAFQGNAYQRRIGQTSQEVNSR